MQITRHLLSAVAFSSLVFGTVQSASAKDFDQRASLEKRSLASGVGQDQVPLLRRLPGTGRSNAIAAAREFVEPAGGAARRWSTEVDARGRHTRLQSDAGHRIKVTGDGDLISYRAPERVAPQGVALEARKSNQELERDGRAFIHDKLRKLVRIGAKDELVPLKTEHEIDSRQADGAKEVSSQVVASTVVFGRRVGGIDVIGAGSKVAVTFANDGSVLGFDVDWPEYVSTGRSQRPLKIEALRARASTLGSMKFKAESVTLKRFACGYVDMGGRRNDRDKNALVQTGCHVAYVGQRTAEAADAQSATAQTTTGVSDFIPAGEVVEADRGWPQAEAVRTHGDVSAGSELTPALYPASAQPGSE